MAKRYHHKLGNIEPFREDDIYGVLSEVITEKVLQRSAELASDPNLPETAEELSKYSHLGPLYLSAKVFVQRITFVYLFLGKGDQTKEPDAEDAERIADAMRAMKPGFAVNGQRGDLANWPPTNMRSVSTEKNNVPIIVGESDHAHITADAALEEAVITSSVDTLLIAAILDKFLPEEGDEWKGIAPAAEVQKEAKKKKARYLRDIMEDYYPKWWLKYGLETDGQRHVPIWAEFEMTLWANA